MKKKHKQIADDIYEDFCNNEGFESEELSKVWDEVEDIHGYIETGTVLDRLVQEAIRFAINNVLSKDKVN